MSNLSQKIKVRNLLVILQFYLILP